MDNGNGGKCRRLEQLEVAARCGSTQASAALEDAPELPEPLAYIWAWWCDFARGRAAGFERAHATWTEIEAWCRLKHRQLTIFEVDLLIEIDQLKPAERELE